MKEKMFVVDYIDSLYPHPVQMFSDEILISVAHHIEAIMEQSKRTRLNLRKPIPFQLHPNPIIINLSTCTLLTNYR